MSLPFAIMVVLNFAVTGFNAAVSIFREGCGLYYEGRYRPVFTALLNIFLSILFVKLWGITGIITATTVSILLTTIWYDAYIVFRHVFNEGISRYLFRYVCELVELGAIGFVAYNLCSVIPVDNIIGLVIKGAVSIILFNIGFWLLYHRNPAYINLRHIIVSMLKSKKS